MSNSGRGYETIEFKATQGDGVGWLTLRRPEKLNAVNIPMMDEFSLVIDHVASHQELKVLVLTGEGRAFSAGGDVTPGSNIDPEHVLPNIRMMRKVSRMVLGLKGLKKPIIAAVRGPALGVGCSLAIACDIIVAADNAKFGYPNVLRGIHPDGGASYLLPRIIGLARAGDMLLTGRIVDAFEAKEIGLVSRVVPEEQLLGTVTQLALDLARGPSVAIDLAKVSMNEALEMNLASALEAEARAEAICAMTEDVKEGAQAWIEKRSPVYRGE